MVLVTRDAGNDSSAPTLLTLAPTPTPTPAPGVAAAEAPSKPWAALTLSERSRRKAAKAGFDWPDAHGAFEKVNEELDELGEEEIERLVKGG